MTFKEVLSKLDRFTAPPVNGDYDQHTQQAMKSVYNLMSNKDPLYLRVVATLVMVCGMIGSLAIAHAIWEGYYFFITGSSLGMFWCYRKGTYTLLALDAWFTMANAIGIYNQIIMGG